ncbi:hypothetical protein ACGFMK_35300 [Amycolatopsis sp. NPDC049252]|uniref:hypothetical protein n=1 Tax=Amycolatopsis sp. NPDC049252 TaxID=3363933 RepID=UPI0037120011
MDRTIPGHRRRTPRKKEAQTWASDSSTEPTSAQQENARLKATVADLQKQLGERQAPATTGTAVRQAGTISSPR